MTPDEICQALRATRYRWTTERELQDGIEARLKEMCVAFAREHVLSDTDRIDFLLADGTGIEVKTRGGLNPLLAQLGRYSQSLAISSLVVVTARSQLSRLPASIGGKQIRVVALLGGIL